MPKNTVITYPIPIYQNLPIEPQFYQPRMFFISSISLGVLTVVTTSIDHDYVIGQEVRLIIPNKYGSRGLNEKKAYVVSIPSPNQVTLDLDSNGVDPFIPNPTYLPFESKTLPQIIAIGDINFGAINASGRVNQVTFILGSFINISPQ